MPPNVPFLHLGFHGLGETVANLRVFPVGDRRDGRLAKGWKWLFLLPLEVKLMSTPDRFAARPLSRCGRAER